MEEKMLDTANACDPSSSVVVSISSVVLDTSAVVVTTVVVTTVVVSSSFGKKSSSNSPLSVKYVRSNTDVPAVIESCWKNLREYQQ